ncbi:MAG: chromate resistance protein ChrB domain-containing protein [Pseudomonadota bacterium]
MPSHSLITHDRLARLIGTPDCPVLVDICIDEDFAEDPRLVPGAFRHPFQRIEDLAPRLAGRETVVICQKGLKLSDGAAALLRSTGLAARKLQGGMIGWRDAGLPLIPAAALPARRPDGRTLWVTPERPGVDPIACVWLIRRFADPGARILFVDPAEAALIAVKFDARPFAIAEASTSRPAGFSGFAGMLGAFRLETGPLLRLAALVSAAGQGGHPQVPEAAGLRAAIDGFSRIHGDDHALTDAALALLDAYYARVRDEAVDGPSGQPVTVA